MTRLLLPLILVPADCGDALRPEYASALDTAVGAVLTWYAPLLGERPFDPGGTAIIGGLLPRAAYTATPDTETVIQAELAAYYPDIIAGNGTTLYVVYALLGMDPYRCPDDVLGARNAIGGELPVLIVQSSGSLDAFVDGQNPDDPNTGSRAAQTGALAHEVGHALGLQHPTDPATMAMSVMYSWWNWPDTGLGPAEVALARANINLAAALS